jgi:molecular chaperone GrpE
MPMNTNTSNNKPEDQNGAAETAEAATLEGEKNEAPSELESLQAKLQEADKKYLYLYSDFENFRRRNERERMDFLKFGHEGFLRELLQVADNFERALEHAKSVESEKGSPMSQVVQGIEMIHYQLMESLKNQGVAHVKTLGAKFDPAFHEAVADEDSEAEASTILREAQKGYTLHARLLRPARVVVAKKKV